MDNPITANKQNQEAGNINGRDSFGKSITPYFVTAIGFFLISVLFGLNASPEVTGDTMEELIQAFKPIIEKLGPSGPFALLLFIFANNAVKALAALAMGIVLGLPPLFFICGNGFVIGITIAALHSHTGYGIIAAALIPHGIIEIPMLLLSTTLGLKIGLESIKHLMGQKSQVKMELRHSLKIYLKWILTGLFIAAIIEVFVTPLIILLAGGKELFIR
jgi:stage II sporulation protein M